MRVDNSHRLQIGIDDYGPNKLHAPLFQIFETASDNGELTLSTSWMIFSLSNAISIGQNCPTLAVSFETLVR